MSTARRCLKSPRSHPPTPPWSHKSISWSWMDDSHPFSFIVNRPPHLWDKAISDSDLETPRSRSWVWSKVKVIQSAQYHINSLPFHSTSIRPTIPISKFDLETSKVKVMSEVKGQGHLLYPVSNQYTSFSFHINRTNHSWDMAQIGFDLEKKKKKTKEKLPKYQFSMEFPQNLIR